MKSPFFYKLFPILSRRGKTDVGLRPDPGLHDDAIDKLRGEILYRLDQKYDNGCSERIGVASTDYGEGAYKTAEALAVSLSSVRGRVLLIDLDFRKRLLSASVPVEGTYGAETYFSDPAGPHADECFYSLSGKLDFLPVMQEISDPSAILETLHQNGSLETLSRNYDAIVCSLPPIRDYADAASAARDLDSIIMTVREGYTQQGVLASCLAASSILTEKTLGVMYYKEK